MELREIKKEIIGYRKQVAAIAALVNDIEKLDKNTEENLQKIRLRLDKLEKEAQKNRNKTELIDLVKEWMQEYRTKLLGVSEKIQRRFAVELEEELKRISLNLVGQYPLLRAGFFSIEVNFNMNNATIWYGPRQERLIQMALSVSKIAGKIDYFRKNLGSDLGNGNFFEKLKKAYYRATNGHRGEPANIVNVMAEMSYLVQSGRFFQDPKRDNYRSYGRADFSYDLFKFRNENIGQKVRERVKLKVATRAHTRRRSDFLWIPDDERGGGTVYSHIQIMEIQK